VSHERYPMSVNQPSRRTYAGTARARHPEYRTHDAEGACLRPSR
jgi:hypothetical protein